MRKSMEGNKIDDRLRVMRMIIKNCLWRNVNTDCIRCQGKNCEYVIACMKDYEHPLQMDYENGGDISEKDEQYENTRSNQQ